MHELSYIVGIGGSAGGLIAYRELLSALPASTSARRRNSLVALQLLRKFSPALGK